jgi:hypothetical protein
MALTIIQDHDIFEGIKELENLSTYLNKVYFLSYTKTPSIEQLIDMDVLIDYLVTLCIINDLEIIVAGYITPKVLKMILLLDSIATVKVLNSSWTTTDAAILTENAETKEVIIDKIRKQEILEETEKLMKTLWPI